MRWIGPVVLAAALIGCDFGKQSSEGMFAGAQAKSPVGSTQNWKFRGALPLAELQKMRDRAYRYCKERKAADEHCLVEQDYSLFAYARAFEIVWTFSRENSPIEPFARAHKENAAAFSGVDRYCRSVYVDAGSSDARGLGPCVSAGIGADYFALVGVE